MSKNIIFHNNKYNNLDESLNNIYDIYYKYVNNMQLIYPYNDNQSIELELRFGNYIEYDNNLKSYRFNSDLGSSNFSVILRHLRHLYTSEYNNSYILYYDKLRKIIDISNDKITLENKVFKNINNFVEGGYRIAISSEVKIPDDIGKNTNPNRIVRRMRYTFIINDNIKIDCSIIEQYKNFKAIKKCTDIKSYLSVFDQLEKQDIEYSVEIEFLPLVKRNILISLVLDIIRVKNGGRIPLLRRQSELFIDIFKKEWYNNHKKDYPKPIDLKECHFNKKTRRTLGFFTSKTSPDKFHKDKSVKKYIPVTEEPSTTDFKFFKTKQPAKRKLKQTPSMSDYYILNGKYNMTIKADGERFYMVVKNNMVFLINNNFKIIVLNDNSGKPGDFEKPDDSKKSNNSKKFLLKNMIDKVYIYEGELVSIFEDGKYLREEFLIFDVVKWDSIDITKKKFEDRLAKLQMIDKEHKYMEMLPKQFEDRLAKLQIIDKEHKHVKILSNEFKYHKKLVKYYYSKLSEESPRRDIFKNIPTEISIKKFYNFDNISEFKSSASILLGTKYKYSTDGLVITNKGIYFPNVIFKWKEIYTIDFQIKYIDDNIIKNQNYDSSLDRVMFKPIYDINHLKIPSTYSKQNISYQDKRELSNLGINETIANMDIFEILNINTDDKPQTMYKTVGVFDINQDVSMDMSKSSDLLKNIWDNIAKLNNVDNLHVLVSSKENSDNVGLFEFINPEDLHDDGYETYYDKTTKPLEQKHVKLLGESLYDKQIQVSTSSDEPKLLRIDFDNGLVNDKIIVNRNKLLRKCSLNVTSVSYNIVTYKINTINVTDGTTFENIKYSNNKYTYKFLNPQIDTTNNKPYVKLVSLKLDNGKRVDVSGSKIYYTFVDPLTNKLQDSVGGKDSQINKYTKLYITSGMQFVFYTKQSKTKLYEFSDKHIMIPHNIHDGAIVECEYNKIDEEFIPVRMRIDKKNPNFIDIANSVYGDIKYPITKDKILKDGIFGIDLAVNNVFQQVILQNITKNISYNERMKNIKGRYDIDLTNILIVNPTFYDDVDLLYQLIKKQYGILPLKKHKKFSVATIMNDNNNKNIQRNMRIKSLITMRDKDGFSDNITFNYAISLRPINVFGYSSEKVNEQYRNLFKQLDRKMANISTYNGLKYKTDDLIRLLLKSITNYTLQNQIVKFDMYNKFIFHYLNKNLLDDLSYLGKAIEILDSKTLSNYTKSITITIYKDLCHNPQYIPSMRRYYDSNVLESYTIYDNSKYSIIRRYVSYNGSMIPIIVLQLKITKRNTIRQIKKILMMYDADIDLYTVNASVIAKLEAIRTGKYKTTEIIDEYTQSIFNKYRTFMRKLKNDRNFIKKWNNNQIDSIDNNVILKNAYISTSRKLHMLKNVDDRTKINMTQPQSNIYTYMLLNNNERANIPNVYEIVEDAFHIDKIDYIFDIINKLNIFLNEQNILSYLFEKILYKRKLIYKNIKILYEDVYGESKKVEYKRQISKKEQTEISATYDRKQRIKMTPVPRPIKKYMIRSTNTFDPTNPIKKYIYDVIKTQQHVKLSTDIIISYEKEIAEILRKQDIKNLSDLKIQQKITNPIKQLNDVYKYIRNLNNDIQESIQSYCSGINPLVKTMKQASYKKFLAIQQKYNIEYDKITKTKTRKMTPREMAFKIDDNKNVFNDQINMLDAQYNNDILKKNINKDNIDKNYDIKLAEIKDNYNIQYNKIINTRVHLPTSNLSEKLNELTRKYWGKLKKIGGNYYDIITDGSISKEREHMLLQREGIVDEKHDRISLLQEIQNKYFLLQQNNVDLPPLNKNNFEIQLTKICIFLLLSEGLKQKIVEYMILMKNIEHGSLLQNKHSERLFSLINMYKNTINEYIGQELRNNTADSVVQTTRRELDSNDKTKMVNVVVRTYSLLDRFKSIDLVQYVDTNILSRDELELLIPLQVITLNKFNNIIGRDIRNIQDKNFLQEYIYGLLRKINDNTTELVVYISLDNFKYIKIPPEFQTYTEINDWENEELSGYHYSFEFYHNNKIIILLSIYKKNIVEFIGKYNHLIKTYKNYGPHASLNGKLIITREHRTYDKQNVVYYIKDNDIKYNPNKGKLYYPSTKTIKITTTNNPYIKELSLVDLTFTYMTTKDDRKQISRKKKKRIDVSRLTDRSVTTYNDSVIKNMQMKQQASDEHFRKQVIKYKFDDKSKYKYDTKQKQRVLNKMSKTELKKLIKETDIQTVNKKLRKRLYKDKDSNLQLMAEMNSLETALTQKKFDIFYTKVPYEILVKISDNKVYIFHPKTKTYVQSKELTLENIGIYPDIQSSMIVKYFEIRKQMLSNQIIRYKLFDANNSCHSPQFACPIIVPKNSKEKISTPTHLPIPDKKSFSHPYFYKDFPKKVLLPEHICTACDDKNNEILLIHMLNIMKTKRLQKYKFEIINKFKNIPIMPIIRHGTRLDFEKRATDNIFVNALLLQLSDNYIGKDITTKNNFVRSMLYDIFSNNKYVVKDFNVYQNALNDMYDRQSHLMKNGLTNVLVNEINFISDIYVISPGLKKYIYKLPSNLFVSNNKFNKLLLNQSVNIRNTYMSLLKKTAKDPTDAKYISVIDNINLLNMKIIMQYEKVQFGILKQFGLDTQDIYYLTHNGIYLTEQQYYDIFNTSEESKNYIDNTLHSANLKYPPQGLFQDYNDYILDEKLYENYNYIIKLLLYKYVKKTNVTNMSYKQLIDICKSSIDFTSSRLNNSDLITNNSDLITNNSDLITNNSDLITNNSDLITNNSDLVLDFSDTLEHNITHTEHNEILNDIIKNFILRTHDILNIRIYDTTAFNNVIHITYSIFNKENNYTIEDLLQKLIMLYRINIIHEVLNNRLYLDYSTGEMVLTKMTSRYQIIKKEYLIVKLPIPKYNITDVDKLETIFSKLFFTKRRLTNEQKYKVLEKFQLNIVYIDEFGFMEKEIVVNKAYKYIIMFSLDDSIVKNDQGEFKFDFNNKIFQHIYYFKELEYKSTLDHFTTLIQDINKTYESKIHIRMDLLSKLPILIDNIRDNEQLTPIQIVNILSTDDINILSTDDSFDDTYNKCLASLTSLRGIINDKFLNSLTNYFDNQTEVQRLYIVKKYQVLPKHTHIYESYIVTLQENISVISSYLKFIKSISRFHKFKKLETIHTLKLNIYKQNIYKFKEKHVDVNNITKINNIMLGEIHKLNNIIHNKIIQVLKSCMEKITSNKLVDTKKYIYIKRYLNDFKKILNPSKEEQSKYNSLKLYMKIYLQKINIDFYSLKYKIIRKNGRQVRSLMFSKDKHSKNIGNVIESDIDSYVHCIDQYNDMCKKSSIIYEARLKNDTDNFKIVESYISTLHHVIYKILDCKNMSEVFVRKYPITLKNIQQYIKDIQHYNNIVQQYNNNPIESIGPEKFRNISKYVSIQQKYTDYKQNVEKRHLENNIVQLMVYYLQVSGINNDTNTLRVLNLFTRFIDGSLVLKQENTDIDIYKSIYSIIRKYMSIIHLYTREEQHNLKIAKVIYSSKDKTKLLVLRTEQKIDSLNKLYVEQQQQITLCSIYRQNLYDMQDKYTTSHSANIQTQKLLEDNTRKEQVLINQQNALTQRINQYNKLKQQINDIEKNHEQKLHDIKNDHKQKLLDIKKNYEQQLINQQKALQQKIEQQKALQQKINDIKREHKQNLLDIKKNYELLDIANDYEQKSLDIKNNQELLVIKKNYEQKLLDITKNYEQKSLDIKNDQKLLIIKKDSKLELIKLRKESEKYGISISIKNIKKIDLDEHISQLTFDHIRGIEYELNITKNTLLYDIKLLLLIRKNLYILQGYKNKNNKDIESIMHEYELNIEYYYDNLSKYIRDTITYIPEMLKIKFINLEKDSFDTINIHDDYTIQYKGINLLTDKISQLIEIQKNHDKQLILLNSLIIKEDPVQTKSSQTLNKYKQMVLQKIRISGYVQDTIQGKMTTRQKAILNMIQHNIDQAKIKVEKLRNKIKYDAVVKDKEIEIKKLNALKRIIVRKKEIRRPIEDTSDISFVNEDERNVILRTSGHAEDKSEYELIDSIKSSKSLIDIDKDIKLNILNLQELRELREIDNIE